MCTCFSSRRLLATRSCEIEGLPPAQHRDACHLNVHQVRLEFDARNGPPAAKMRPQWDRLRQRQVLTSGDVAMGLVARSAAQPLLFSPSRNRNFNHPLRSFSSATICNASEWQTSSSAQPSESTMRQLNSPESSARRTPRSREPATCHSSRCRHHTDRIKCPLRYFSQSFLKQSGRNRGIGYDESQSRRHVRMNHPRALGAAHQVHALARHLERNRSSLWARVRGADGER